MVRSARRVSAVCAATLPAAVALTGCVSTQQIAARARLVSARELASQSTTQFGQLNPNVTLGRVTLIHARTGTAFVVSLRNDSSSTLTDLPISVGILGAADHRVYLNRSANLDYFESHVAAIGSHGDTTWVFTTDRRVAGGRPFATVGVSDLHSSVGARLPRIAVSLRPGGSGTATATVDVSIWNHSAIPQYGLQVYAIGIRAGREVEAGRAEVTHLGTYAKTTLSVTLLGAARRATLELIALPTIFS